MNTKALTLRQLIKDALLKDEGNIGDVTSLALIPEKQTATANFIVKDNLGVISGLKVVKTVFEVADKTLKFTPLIKDGDQVKKGQVIATVAGSARSILKSERIALEFIRRLSGIATKTSLFVKEVAGTKATILDTRKILPGYGQLDKQAVVDGGGANHRLNLSAMGLIKNNHIDLLNGDIKKAIKLFKSKYPNIPLEVEVRDLKELKLALESSPDRILLDNMDAPLFKKSVALRNKLSKNIPLEASGNVSLTNVKQIAQTGIDFISVGSLTHSVTAFDLSLHINFTK